MKLEFQRHSYLAATSTTGQLEPEEAKTRSPHGDVPLVLTARPILLRVQSTAPRAVSAQLFQLLARPSAMVVP